MVAPMKKRGLFEVRSALRRARRLHALGRISRTDFRFIEERLQQVEDRITWMRESEREEAEEPF